MTSANIPVLPFLYKSKQAVMYCPPEQKGVVGADVLSLPGWFPYHGGSLAQSQCVSTEDIAWPFPFVFQFEILKCFAKYYEDS